MTKKINILLEDDAQDKANEKIKSFKSVMLRASNLYSLVPPGKTGPALSGWFESGGLLYLHSDNVEKAAGTLSVVDEEDIDEALEKLKKYKNILTRMRAGTWNPRLGALASKTLYKRGGHGAAAMNAVNEAIGSLEGRKKDQETTLGRADTVTGYEGDDEEGRITAPGIDDDEGAKALQRSIDAGEGSESDAQDSTEPPDPESGKFLEDADMNTAESEVTDAANSNGDHPGLVYEHGETPAGKLTNYIWLKVLGKPWINGIDAGVRENAIIDWWKIHDIAVSKLGEESTVKTAPRKGSGAIAGSGDPKKPKQKSAKTDYGDTSGNEWSWRARGRDQYLQFYKDLKTAGLLGKLFKGGKIRTKGKGGTDNVQLDESDGVDFKWGGMHRAAYGALIDKVRDSGHESIEAWRKAGGKAAGEAGEAPQAGEEKTVPASKVADWNKRREMFGLPPLEGERLKRVIQAHRNGETDVEGKPLFNGELGLTGAEEAKLVRDGDISAKQVATGKGLQAAGVDVPGGGPGARRSATANARKVASKMIAKDARTLQAAIEKWGGGDIARRIITKYARGGEHGDTGVPMTLTQLYTRFQKFANVNLIQALQDDGEDDLVQIVRYGLKGAASPEGASKGVMRRGAGKDTTDDLQDDAERLIRMGPDKTGTDEDGIQDVIDRNARNLVGLAKAYRELAANDDRVDSDVKTLIDMLEDEGMEELARDVQTQLQRQAQTVRESKLRKLRKLFKEEFAKKLAEQSTTGGMTLPSGKDIGAMSIDPADLEQMLDEPHPTSPEAPAVSKQTTKSRSGLDYTPERKAFIRYIKGLRKRGKLSKTQEMKLRRALFSRKYTPKDTKGVEITKLIRSEVVKKMKLDKGSKKVAADDRSTDSGRVGGHLLEPGRNIPDSTAGMEATEFKVASGRAEIDAAIQNVLKRTTDARAAAGDTNAKRRLQRAKKRFDRATAAVEKNFTMDNISKWKRAQRAVRQAIAAVRADKSKIDIVQTATDADYSLRPDASVEQIRANLKKMRSAKNASSPEMQAAIARREKMLARKLRSKRPSIQTATDQP